MTLDLSTAGESHGPALVAILTLRLRRRFSGRAIVLWAALYAIFVAYVVVAT